MAGPLDNPAAFTAPSYLQAFNPASSLGANRFDEGYSEDTRSQTGSDMVMRQGEGAIEADLQYGLPEWVMGMNEHERSGALTVPDPITLPTDAYKQNSPMPSSDLCVPRRSRALSTS